MQCAYHPDREAIWMCDDCGKHICGYCRSIWEGKVYCPDCFLLHSGEAHSELFTTKAVRLVKNESSRISAVLLLILTIATYLPIFLYWDGEHIFYVTLLVVAGVSLFFQVALVVRNTWWAWWGSAISWWVDILIVVVAYAYSVDPTGSLSAVALVVIGIPAGIFLLLGKVSDRTAIEVPIFSIAVIFIIALIYGLYQEAGPPALLLLILLFFIGLYVSWGRLF